MRKCINKVMQSVRTAYDYNEVEMRCGDTDIYGGTIQCDSCLEKGLRPWYMCKHGRDLSENEMACEQCNAEYE